MWNEDEYSTSSGSSGESQIDKFLDADELDAGFSDLNDLELELLSSNRREFA
jgi:hypothetical protein